MTDSIFFGFAAAKWEDRELQLLNYCAFFVFVFLISGRRFEKELGWMFMKPCVSVCLHV